MNPAHPFPPHLSGLTAAQAEAALKRHGPNELPKGRSPILDMLAGLLGEPMLMLLLGVVIIYFVLGERAEGYFMLAAVIAVSGISIFQDWRSRKAIRALEALTAPLSKVIRDGNVLQVPSRQIVPGDLLIAEEGTTVNADGSIVFSHDFAVNESILTGEAMSVFKSADGGEVFSGTTVSGGLAVIRVTKTGQGTRIGQLGLSVLDIKPSPSPLQLQIEHFVKIMAVIGIAVFAIVTVYHYLTERDILASLLKGLTLAMSILPEEIPVAFATFMALGAWRLMKHGVIVRQLRTVETLGSATVICTDKTGTITENRMHLQGWYVHADRRYMDEREALTPNAADLLRVAMWASEPVPFDPMERSIHQRYAGFTDADERPGAEMVHEYPLSGKPPMMTHVFRLSSGRQVIAAKGAPEAILACCDLGHDELRALRAESDRLAGLGYRVLGVARGPNAIDAFPAAQSDIPMVFLGLLAFHDPPKANIREVVDAFRAAGIGVRIITGDNARTTAAIAAQAGLHGLTAPVDGDRLMHMPADEFRQTARTSTLFTRMFPEAKLAVVEALQADNEVVAFVGDGVNDGPALKAAHIGIAMGHRGTDLARSAAALVLQQDDLSAMVTALGAGRRIYTNLKKAIRYIVSIHIPIILTVSLPLLFGWIYPDIFTPVHVIFLELVMGPTCSIVFEREPMEKDALRSPPRAVNAAFLTRGEILLSIIQGLMITVAVLGMYHYGVRHGAAESTVRSMVFTALIFANILLTLVNRSFIHSLFTCLTYKNNLLVITVGVTLLSLFLMLNVPPVRSFFGLALLTWPQLGICLAAASAGVLWIELLKAYVRAGLASSR